MAQPQTEEGFVMVALDLFAALMAADLPNRDAIVLAEVLLHTYGPNKPKRGTSAVHIDPAQIEHYTGLHRNNARKAVHELVAANILHPQPDGAYKFNKDYETWRPGGEPVADRLGGGLLRFAASALTRHGTKNRKASVPIQRDCVSTDNPIQRDSIPNGFLNPAGLGYGGSCESPGIGPNVYATGDIGGSGTARARPSEELEIREKKNPPLTPPRGGVRERDSDSSGSDPAKTEANRIADLVIRDVFGLKDSAGNADPDAAGMLACWIVGASERAVVSAAHTAKLKAKRDPLRFLVGICQNGLSEPPAHVSVPAPTANGKPQRSAEEIARLTAAIDAEQSKIRAARPRDRSKPDGTR